LDFNGRTSNLSKKGLLFLSRLAKVLMLIGPGYKSVFESHVDATDNLKEDMALSLSRVSKIKRFLLRYSFFTSDTVEIKAKGGQVPLIPNVNKRSRMRNRRIELQVFRFAK
jgi:outer membrane protein OmpA-like peptidoglycan-associated protein